MSNSSEPLEPLEPLEIEPSQGKFAKVDDARPQIEKPLPVRLVAVEDVKLITEAGLEKPLEAFYVELFGFERAMCEKIGDALVLRAENFSIHFEVIEPPFEREDLRMLGVEIESLRELERELIDRVIPFEWEKGLQPGVRAIVLRDPAGNWLQIREARLL